MNIETYEHQCKKLDERDQRTLFELYQRSNRPYDGQPHTDEGVRGQAMVEGLTMRDVSDCILLGFFLASGLPREEWPQSVYDLPVSTMDPNAVKQNVMCNIEKMMGVFPNLPYGMRIKL